MSAYIDADGIDEDDNPDDDNIADADGLDDATFAYRWMRIDGGRTTVIEGATDRCYRLGADDRGKQVKVEAGFVDDDDNPEARTSAAFPADGMVAEAAAPPWEGGAATCTWELLDAQMTVGRFSQQFGYAGNLIAASLAPTTFSVSQYDYEVFLLLHFTRGGIDRFVFNAQGSNRPDWFPDDWAWPPADLTLHLGGQSFPFGDAAYPRAETVTLNVDVPGNHVWAAAGLDWDEDDVVDVRITRLLNYGAARTGGPSRPCRARSPTRAACRSCSTGRWWQRARCGRGTSR